MKRTILLGTTEQELDDCFRFNVTTAFAISRLCVPRMVATTGRGVIVNVSSVAGRFHQAGFAAYETAKAALSLLTSNLAQNTVG